MRYIYNKIKKILSKFLVFKKQDNKEKLDPIYPLW